ncbi:fungal-specific transcription factor domain-containing protein [Pterulicium gracile]|uniref:Fungal-specific transcription factor domain-containing protein n=1 Tax=Pterulicium gracile TaxID=1884261 RepID=A0A5C3QPA3_9AGAR|nr:fungal-specific transcription factor domain-containing protein [Pterula gracilis]
MYESYDLRYQHTWDVTTTGDGLITVQKPHADDQNSASALRSSKPSETRVERDVVESLLNSYFTNVAPLLPVITQSEFLSSEKPPPTILLYSMCLVAAARRDVPQHVFDSIRHAVNHVIKVEDVLSSASIVNLQSLLILSMCGDSHSQFVPTALSALWIRLGTAIRMAQDLGLHRAESVRKQIEVRRRIWGACVISDRWTSLIYGHPYMIDVQDCDVRLPSSGDPNDLYMDELVRLSVILGRVLKTIYSPSGLAFTTDEMLYDIFEDLQGWKKRLPAHLAYHGPDTPESAGLLHLLYACVSMIFWRVFMRISYLCPAHIKFGLTVEQWTALVQLTGEGIDWLDRHEKMYDVWLIVAYAATSCALVQYHTWARRKDDDAAAKLRKLRDCVRRWEGSISPDHMSARRKTAEIIALLYEATQGSPPVVTEAPALNPTGGVVGKHPIRMTYKKDPSRPGGGVFVADDEAELQDAHNLEPGTVITKDEAYRHANTQDNEERRAEGDWSENTSSGNGGSVVARRLMRPMNREYLDREFLLSSSSFAPPLEEQLPFNNNSPSGQHPQSAARAGDSNAHNMIQFTPLVRRGAEQAGDGIMNVNPAMNTDPDLMGGNVQVMNLLDSAPPPHIPVTSGAFDQLVHADNFLDGLPGGMFDWGEFLWFSARALVLIIWPP